MNDHGMIMWARLIDQISLGDWSWVWLGLSAGGLISLWVSSVPNRSWVWGRPGSQHWIAERWPHGPRTWRASWPCWTPSWWRGRWMGGAERLQAPPPPPSPLLCPWPHWGLLFAWLLSSHGPVSDTHLKVFGCGDLYLFLLIIQQTCFACKYSTRLNTVIGTFSL